MNPHEYDAQTLHEAMSGLGTKDKTLIEIITTRSTEEKIKIREAFARKYNRDLEKWIESDTSGDYKKALISLLNTPRSNKFTPEAVKGLVDKLYHAGEGKIGTDERTFIQIFSSESFDTLRAVFMEYPNHHKHHTMEHAIKSEFSYNIQETLLTIVHYVMTPAEFWADKLRNSMAGLGTKDTTLIRVIVTQKDNMPAISDAFNKKHKQSLEAWIKSDCSGDYAHLLVEIVRLHTLGVVS